MLNTEERATLAEGLQRASRNFTAGRFEAVHEVLDTLETEFGPLAETDRMRGLALCAQGKFDEGMALLEQAAKFLPHDGSVRADIGALLAQRGRFEEALPHFEEATRLAPEYAAGWSNLGGVYFMIKDYAKAIRPLRKAVELDPNLLDAQMNLATALSHARRTKAAIDAYYKVLSLNPNDVSAHLGLSGALYQAERHDTALYHARKALELRPNTPQAHLHIGNALASMGQMEDAAEHLLKAAQARGGIGALARLIHLRKTTPDSPEFDRLTTLLERVEAADREQEPQVLYFAAGKAYADLGDYDRSFDYYSKGNAAQAKETSFDLANHMAQVDRMIEVITPELVTEVQGKAGLTELAPIFVCGMPRSGTTLTELMLSRHSAVEAGGELNAGLRAIGQTKRLVAHMEEKDPAAPTADEFTQVGEFYLEAVRREGLSQEIITDKMPINHMNIGLLALALPRAKFVIMRRHPLDCCLSNWTQNFGRNQPFSTEFTNLGGVYRAYRRISDYWADLLPDRVMILPYEELVSQPEPQMRKVLDFCDLPWEADVLDPAASSRTVNTASISQVRAPINKDAIAKWRRYGAHLAPLAQDLSAYLSDEDLAAAGL